MSKLKLIIILLSVLILMSCEKEFNFYKTSHKPVINCLFNPEDTLYLNISKNLDVFKPDSLRFIQASKIYIYSNSNLVSELIENPVIKTETSNNDNFLGFYHLPGLMIENNKTYTLKGRVLNFEIYATDTVPQKIEITRMDTVTKTLNVNGLNSNIVSTVYFNDPPGKNYYALSVDEVLTLPDNHQIVFQVFSPSCTSPALEAKIENVYFSQLVFSDKLFEGKPYSITFSINTNKQSYYKQSLRIKLLSISGCYYKYAISYYKQVLASKDFYAEPSSIYSNVKGGLGIFAAYSKSVKEIILYENNTGQR